MWGEALVDVNAAPEPVLAALPGVERAGARALMSQRGEAPFASAFDVLPLLGPAGEALLPLLSVVPSHILLVSRGWLSGHPLIHEVQAAYEVQGQRLKLQAWRERDL